MAWQRLASGALLAAGVTLAGCSQAYDAPMPSDSPAVAATTDTAGGEAAATAPADAPAEPANTPTKPPDVNSSGPVGKTILAPTDALD